jgi:DNA-directed RNA polymerase specialized sigma24 family protein
MRHPSIGHASTRFKPIDEHLREYRLELESLAGYLLWEPETRAGTGPGMLEKVMRTVGASPGVGTLRWWLHRTASTEARRLGLRSAGVGDSCLDAVAAGDFDRHRSHPHDLVSGVEVRLGLLEALAGLPDNYRCALLLKDGAGLAVGEVARVMGTSPSSVRSVLYRARQAMRGRPGL